MPYTSITRILQRLVGSGLALLPGAARAAVFEGGGIDSGLSQASGVTGVASGDPRTIAANVITAILNFMALFAVIAIVIAGIYMIVSLGNEEQRDRARRIVFYTLIGLVIILLARILVGLVTVYLASQLT